MTGVHDYIAAGMWNDDTLWSVLDGLADAHPDRPAIVAGGATIYYGDLRERVARVAGGLAGLGIGKGDVVSVQLPNIPEYLVALFAVTSLGAVFGPIHMPYGPREIAELVRHGHSRAIICPGANAPALLESRADLPSLQHVIAVGEAPPGATSFAELAAAPPRYPGDDAPRATDPYLLMFTSGTSASPKAVLSDSRLFLSNARLNRVEKAIDENTVMMSAPPFTHLLGLYTVLLTLYGGGASLLLPSFSPPAFIETIAGGRPSHIFTAPAHVLACEAGGLLTSEKLSSIRYAIISGSIAAPDVYTGFQRYLENGVVGQLWGMTECQCGMFTRPDEPLERAATSCGRASVGSEIRVCDADDAVLPPDTEGDLQIRGCSVFDGYHLNPQATQAAFTGDGWFRTGDLARIDAAGFATITGRSKDIINRGGVKINPADVEEIIDRHPDIVQSAIVPMPDAVLGEKACCFAVARPGAAIALADVTGWLETHGVARLKWPERLEIVDAMPLTPTRKVIKGRLRIPE